MYMYKYLNENTCIIEILDLIIMLVSFYLFTNLIIIYYETEVIDFIQTLRILFYQLSADII